MTWIMAPNNNTAGAKIVSALIIGLIVGFGAGAFWQERRLSDELPSDAVAAGAQETAGEGMAAAEDLKQSAGAAASVELPTAMVEAPSAGSATAALLVNDQSAGGTVTVTQVITPESVWVAVREEKDGKLGNILGARRVGAGANSGVAVELLRPTVAGSSYVAALHKDAGDAAFNYREDVLIEGVEGRFTAK